MVTNSSRIVFAVIDLATKKLLSCYGHGRLSENKEEEKKRRKEVKETLENVNFSIALFKAERKEELKREKEALSLLKTLIKRAKREKVIVSLVVEGDDSSLVVDRGGNVAVAAAAGAKPFFVSLRQLTRGELTWEKEKILDFLRLALKNEGTVEVKVE